MVEKIIHGKAVIETLAGIYEQLFVAPGQDGPEKYKDIVQCGNSAKSKDLSHFITDERDSLIYEETPSGKVRLITLYNRADFVTFLRIMGKRCQMAEIPDTQGASLLDGVINWKTIYAHKEEYLENERKNGNPSPDWDEEFGRFTSDKRNYTDTIIILSVGPYSGVSAEKAGFPENEWIGISDTIRRYHECTHFICRRKYPEKKDAIWDELAADAVGIYAAFNRYDRKTGELFLGISDGRYTGGRLENYVNAETEEEKERSLEELVTRIVPVLEGFERLINAHPDESPYDIAVLLEENMDKLW